MLLEFGHRTQDYPHPKIDGVTARIKIPLPQDFAKWTEKIRKKRTKEYHTDPKSQKVMKDGQGRPLYETEIDLTYTEILETLNEFGETVLGIDIKVNKDGYVPSFAEIVAHEKLGWWEQMPMSVDEHDGRGRWWTDPSNGRSLWVAFDAEKDEPIRTRVFRRWSDLLYDRIYSPEPYAETEEGKGSRAPSTGSEEMSETPTENA